MSKRRKTQEAAEGWLCLTRAQFAKACDNSLYFGLVLGFAAGLAVWCLW